MANEEMDFIVVVWGKGFELSKEAENEETVLREELNIIYSKPDEVHHFNTYDKMKKYLESKEAQKNWDNEVGFNEAALQYIEKHNL